MTNADQAPCERCGWPLKTTTAEGCAEESCSLHSLPETPSAWTDESKAQHFAPGTAKAFAHGDYTAIPNADLAVLALACNWAMRAKSEHVLLEIKEECFRRAEAAGINLG